MIWCLVSYTEQCMCETPSVLLNVVVVRLSPLLGGALLGGCTTFVCRFCCRWARGLPGWAIQGRCWGMHSGSLPLVSVRPHFPGVCRGEVRGRLRVFSCRSHCLFSKVALSVHSFRPCGWTISLLRNGPRRFLALVSGAPVWLLPQGVGDTYLPSPIPAAHLCPGRGCVTGSGWSGFGHPVSPTLRVSSTDSVCANFRWVCVNSDYPTRKLKHVGLHMHPASLHKPSSFFLFLLMVQFWLEMLWGSQFGRINPTTYLDVVASLSSWGTPE